jgi:hypothetical protein
MRNLLLLATALRVVLTDTDAKHLTFDVTEEDFRNYFEIPETAVVDLEKMSSNFAKDPEFNFESVKRFMNGKEQKLYKEKFPEEFKKTSKEKPGKEGESPEKSAADESAEKKEAEKAAKQAEKEAAKKAKEDEKNAALKAKEEEKAKKAAEKEAAKAAKQAEKDAKAASKNAPKPLSRSQEIFLLYKEGKDFAKITEEHPDWNQSHVRNALFTAKNEADKVEKAVQDKIKYDAWLESQSADSEKAEAEEVDAKPEANA